MKLALAYTIAAGLLIDATVYTASQVSRVHDGTQVLTVALLAACAVTAVGAAVGYGLGAGFQAGSAAVYARRMRRQRPVAAPPAAWVPPAGYTPMSEFDDYWAETRRAVAAAEPGDYRPYAAAHAAPLPKTLPMPVITLAEPSWGFNGTRVVEEVGS